MNELYTALMAGAITIVGALVTYIVNSIRSRDIKNRINTLEEFINSDDTVYYIECPNCKSKIELNKVKILVEKQEKK